jgi:ABC-type Fe3+ transport system substrate-binding protein
MTRFCRSAVGPLLAASLLSAPARTDDFDLEIITPHNEQIQAEFEKAFIAHVGRPLKVRWIKQGTGQLLNLLEAKDRSAKGGSFGLDVFFGGGVPDHDLAATRGYLEPSAIPADILAGIPDQIAGVANRDRNGMWFGSALSSFGVLMNRRGLANQNLPEIKTWDDLGQPRMFSWVIIADPRKSASVRVSYELILQQYGWEKGWMLLMQIAANARTIADSSAAIPNEIATGNVLAGPAIDFYAYARIAQAGQDVLGYVNPQGGSAITPDPISLLRKPPHRELAEKFVAFVLSRDGQRLWVLPPGAPGGPQQHALYRLPVRPDVFTGGDVPALVKDPYEQAGAGVFMTMNDELQNERTTLVAELVGAALVDLHPDLKAAWKALIDGGMKEAALAEWRRPPFSEADALQLARQLATGGERESRKITRGWTTQFREQYQRVQRLAR